MLDGFVVLRMLDKIDLIEIDDDHWKCQYVLEVIKVGILYLLEIVSRYHLLILSTPLIYQLLKDAHISMKIDKDVRLRKGCIEHIP